MYVGCYSLNLYCDRENDQHKYREFPHTYTAEFGSECRKMARLDGWIVHLHGECICPKCSKTVPK